MHSRERASFSRKILALFLWPGWIALILASSLQAQNLGPARETPARSTNLLSLDWLVGQVLTNNASLQAARARCQAVRERAVQVQRGNAQPFHGKKEGDGASVGQEPIPAAHESLRMEVATTQADLAQEWVRRLELDLIARARVGYFQYANVTSQLDLNRKNEGLLDKFIEISRAKYQAGEQVQTGWLAAQNESAALLEARLDLERQLAEVRAQLNLLLNRPAYADLRPAAILPFKPLVLSVNRIQAPSHGPPDAQLVFDWLVTTERIQSLALAHRPELRAARSRITAAQARLKLTRQGWIHDPSHLFLPWLLTQSPFGMTECAVLVQADRSDPTAWPSAIREAESNLEGVRHESEALKTEAFAAISNQLKKIETFNAHYQFNRDKLYPLARQTFESTRIQYLGGQANVLEVLAAQRRQREAELNLQQHLTDYLAAIAELESIVGTDPEPEVRTASFP